VATGQDYATVTSHDKSATVSPHAFPDVKVRVADLFV